MPDQAFPPPPFRCEIVARGDDLLVRAVGELDLATIGELDSRVEEALARARRVVLDLRELAFLDSVGVTSLVRWAAAARANGGRLSMVAPAAEVARPLRILEVEHLLPLEDAAPMDA